MGCALCADREAAAGLDPATRVCMRREPESVELVIFDCDGVLVDSERLSVRIEVQLLGELGWSISEAEVIERFVGRSDAHMLAVIEAQLGRPVPEFMTQYRERLFAAFDRELTAVPGVVEALDGIERLGLRPASRRAAATTRWRARWAAPGCSNGSTVGSTAPLRSIGASPRPTCSCSPQRRWASSRQGASWWRTAAPGSPPHDAAGMRSVGFAGGLTPADWLEGPGTVVIEDMAQLLDALGVG